MTHYLAIDLGTDMIPALALGADAEVTLLDEPFSGLDPLNIELLRDIIREERQKGTTVIFSMMMLLWGTSRGIGPRGPVGTSAMMSSVSMPSPNA